jgi:hypothetical protein
MRPTNPPAEPLAIPEGGQEPEPGPAPPAIGWRRIGLACVGPAVIVLAVLIVLRSYAFRGMITTQHGDILEYWLPFFDYLGSTLRSGHVPGFNPYSLAGIPFAPDPQTGWMYLPAMALFTALPAAVAIRWFLVIQPILAGLGVYWFLRSEAPRRPAAWSWPSSSRTLTSASSCRSRERSRGPRSRWRRHHASSAREDGALGSAGWR